MKSSSSSSSALFFVLLLPHAAKTTVVPPTTEFTMWTQSPSDVTSSSCGFVSSSVGGESSFPRMPYVASGSYCAVSSDLYRSGAACGSCYRLTYDGSDGNTDPGRAGSVDVQVVDSGAGRTDHFDCYLPAFEALTGASTGVFTVGTSYERIACDAVTGNARVVLESSNDDGFWCRLVPQNVGGAGTVDGMELVTSGGLTIVGTRTEFSGAMFAFSASDAGCNNVPRTIKLTQTGLDGAKKEITLKCDNAEDPHEETTDWTVGGSGCSSDVNFFRESKPGSTPVPTVSPVVPPKCPSGEPELPNVFCGRGATQSCPNNYYCEIHPTDLYAVCCANEGGGNNREGTSCVNPITGENSTVVNCFADPCEVTNCTNHPQADCVPNYCGGCHALFYSAGGGNRLTDCDTTAAPTSRPSFMPLSAPSASPVVPPKCPSGDPELPNVFCGRGATQSCPNNYYCEIHPTDLYAVCCPDEASTMTPGPSFIPSSVPSEAPLTHAPSNKPSDVPSRAPSNAPWDRPTNGDNSLPPTHMPSSKPTRLPSDVPSSAPSNGPTKEEASPPPTKVPSPGPSSAPSADPASPTAVPSPLPSGAVPSVSPSDVLTDDPSIEPTVAPSHAPSFDPSHSPVDAKNSTAATPAGPSAFPSVAPSIKPSVNDTAAGPPSQVDPLQTLGLTSGTSSKRFGGICTAAFCSTFLSFVAWLG